MLAHSACTQNIKAGHGLWTVDISHDDKYIALGGDDSLLRIFTNDLQLYKTIKTETKGMIRAVHWHPKKNLLAISSRKIFGYGIRKPVKKFNWKVIITAPVPLHGITMEKCWLLPRAEV